MLVADRFEAITLVGRGGMGEVYRARDLATGETVALKLLTMASQEASERFARESRVLCSLRHPRVVRYVAHGIERQQRYLAMEWIDGEDVASRLKNGGLTPAQSVALATLVADGLAAVHAHGVVHRDIKPANLILPGGELERVKILDFGVARNLEDYGGLTTAGDTIGTPNYMSPEQARGEVGIDERADVFALGCVLYECLAGRPPFAAASGVAVMAKILFEDPPLLDDLVPGLGVLDPLLGRMLAKDRRQRPQSASEVADALRALPALEADPRSARAAGRDALTTAERRLVCVVLAAPAMRGAEDDTGTGEWDLDPGQTVTPALLRVAEGHQARVETLRNRSVVALLSSAGSATDLAARAAHCALAMRRALPDLGIALATGRAVMSSLRFPVGDVIDRAAEQLAYGAGRVRIDEVTAGLLDARFAIESPSPGRLELVGEREITDGGGTRRLLGKPTPYVGRERELSLLDGLLAECLEEPAARVALLVGPPGIGKSRLRDEFLKRQRDRGVEAWTARGDPMSAGSPFGLLQQALRAGLGGLEEPRLRARVGRLGLEPWVAEFLGELAGTPFGGEGSVKLRAARRDLGLMGDQMRAAWEQLLRAETARRPLALVFEDLHWGDLPTVNLVDAALRSSADQPLFVLAMARPEVHDLFPALWRERGLHEVRVNALSKKAAEKLARAALPRDAGPEVLARIVEQAAGNAFYLEELIRQAAGGAEGPPGTVLAMLQARLEALPDGARRVLRAASIFGRTFWASGVAALVGGAATSKEVNEWLRQLAEQEIVTPRGSGRFAGEIEHSFRHALVREAAYTMLTDRDRRLGHRLAAEWLTERGEADDVLLAEHLERGDEPGRAVASLRRAAEQALEGNDLAAATARAERGVRLAQGGQELGHLELILAEAHRWRGEWAEAETRAHRALGLLAPGSGPWSAAMGEAALASRVLDHVEALLALVATARAAPAATAGARESAMMRVASLLYYSGEYRLADELLDEVGEPPAGDPVAVATWAYCKGLRAAFGGDPEGALVEAKLAVELYEAAGNLRRGCNLRMLEAMARVNLGDHAVAEEQVVAAIQAAEGMGLTNVATLGRQILGLCAARRGRIDEGLAVERRAADAFAAQADHRLEGTSRRILGELFLRAGRIDDAEREARAAVEILHALPPSRLAALATLAEVLLAAGKAEPALAAARESLSILETLGSAPEGEVLAHLVLARALAAMGQPSEAAFGAARARVLLRADKIRDAQLRRMFLEEVPENAAALRV